MNSSVSDSDRPAWIRGPSTCCAGLHVGVRMHRFLPAKACFKRSLFAFSGVWVQQAVYSLQQRQLTLVTYTFRDFTRSRASSNPTYVRVVVKVPFSVSTGEHKQAIYLQRAEADWAGASYRGQKQSGRVRVERQRETRKREKERERDRTREMCALNRPDSSPCQSRLFRSA